LLHAKNKYNFLCNGQVSPKKECVVKPVFDHISQKFSERNTLEDQLSAVFYYGRAGLGEKCTCQRIGHALGQNLSNFMRRSKDICKMCHNIWERTQLKNEVLATDISYYSKASKIVFTLIEKLLRWVYVIAVGNCYSSPELFGLLNKHETGVVGTVRSDGKGLLDFMGGKGDERKLAVFIRKLMAAKWKDKRDVYMPSGMHNEEMQTAHDKKCGNETTAEGVH
jgi:hypothetical protein